MQIMVDSYIPNMKKIPRLHEKIRANNWNIYRLEFSHCDMVFDLPPEYEPIEKYQGTLGHKINHKFDSDSVFAPMESARYGILLPKLF